MSVRLRISFISAIFMLFLFTSGAPLQQTEDAFYYNETGHWLSGEFFTFFNQTPDALKIYGYPITRVFPHPVRPEVQVQYFQKARMELDPSKPAGQRVSLAPLGLWAYDESTPGKDANIDTSNASCRMFEKTGHAVCFGFMQYYEKYNGAAYFGQPISEVLEINGGRMVQYFEYARMEWRAEQIVGARVVLTDLGRIDFDSRIGIKEYTDPESRKGIFFTTERVNTSLIVRAFPTQPLARANSVQRVYVVVQNQLLQPVEKATVKVTVRRPDGTVSVERASETNASGITYLDVSIGDAAPNQVFRIDVEADLTDGLKAKTSASFRIWW